MQENGAAQPETPSTTPAELRVCAEFGQLPLLRAVAETVAVLADFTLDDVSDIELAVDEVCSVLIKDAQRGSVLTCRFHSGDFDLRVRVGVDTATDRLPDEQSFGWHVLRTLTDSISTTRHPLDRGGFHTVVDFTKSRGGGT